VFKVTKVIHFCYGHRLLRYEGKCRWLHGHNAKVEVELSSSALDPRGMVADFSEVKQKLQAWIDSTLDHRMILNQEDPLLKQLSELQEPFVSLPANPTAENLARHIFEYAKSQGFPVSEVRLWETPTSFASYSGAR